MPQLYAYLYKMTKLKRDITYKSNLIFFKSILGDLLPTFSKLSKF